MNMKCIKKNKIVKRVSDEQAAHFTKELGWKYCPKSEWKKQRKENEDG